MIHCKTPRVKFGAYDMILVKPCDIGLASLYMIENGEYRIFKNAVLTTKHMINQKYLPYLVI